MFGGDNGWSPAGLNKDQGIAQLGGDRARQRAKRLLAEPAGTPAAGRADVSAATVSHCALMVAFDTNQFHPGAWRVRLLRAIPSHGNNSAKLGD
jgi:hypothetical protein